jgi:putative membrane protein
MNFLWFGDWGWFGALVTALFWVVLIAGGILLLQREFDDGDRPSASSAWSALRILEERYARGEIDRDEFLERRTVLLEARRAASPPAAEPPAPNAPAAPAPPGAQAPRVTPHEPTASPQDPTQPIPDRDDRPEQS